MTEQAARPRLREGDADYENHDGSRAGGDGHEVESKGRRGQGRERGGEGEEEQADERSGRGGKGGGLEGERGRGTSGRL